jgi:hypothetical protein
LGWRVPKLNPFTKIGVAHLVLCPHAHQQNGLAERKHKHIVEVGLALLAHTSMPVKFWDEVFATTTYLINRTPSKVIDFMTHYERLFHKKNPIISFFEYLVVHAGPTFVLITLINLLFVPSDWSSWAIVHLIKAIDALMLVQDETTYQETSYLMKEFFLSVSSIPMSALIYGLKSISFLTCFLLVPP